MSTTGASSQHTITVALPQAGQATPMGSGNHQPVQPTPSSNPSGAAGGIPSATGGAQGGGGGGNPASQPVQPTPSSNPSGAAGGTPSATGSGGGGGGSGGGSGTGTSAAQPVQPQVQPNPNGIPSAPGDQSQGGGGGGTAATTTTPAVPRTLQTFKLDVFDMPEDLAAYRRARAAGQNFIGGLRAMRGPYATPYSRGFSAMIGMGAVDTSGKVPEGVSFDMDDSITDEITTVTEGQRPLRDAGRRFRERVEPYRMGMMGAMSMANTALQDSYSATAFGEYRIAGSGLKAMGTAGMVSMNAHGIIGGAALYGAGMITETIGGAKEAGLSTALSMARMERPGAIAMAARGITGSGDDVHNLLAATADSGKNFGFTSGESTYTMTQLDTATGLVGAGSKAATDRALAMSALGIGPGAQAYLRSQVGMNVNASGRALATDNAVASAFSGATALGLTGDRATEYMSRMGSFAQGQNELGIGFTDKDAARMAKFSANLGEGGGIPAGYAISATASLQSTARDAASMINFGGGMAEVALLAEAAKGGGTHQDIRKRLRQMSNDPYAAVRGIKNQLGSDSETTREALAYRVGDEAADKIMAGVSEKDLNLADPAKMASSMPVMQAQAAEEAKTFIIALKDMSAALMGVTANIEERERGRRKSVRSGIEGPTEFPAADSSAMLPSRGL